VINLITSRAHFQERSSSGVSYNDCLYGPSGMLAVHCRWVNWQNHCFAPLYVPYSCMQLKFNVAYAKSAVDFSVLWLHRAYAEWTQSVFILHVSNDILLQPCALHLNLVKEMDKNC